MKKVAIVIMVFILSSIYNSVEGRVFSTLSDCLITSDIGKYTFEGESANMGKGSGVVGIAGHFDLDHEDIVCTGEYSNIKEIEGLPIEEARQKIIGIEVQVTQHAGSESDKWLMHEVERGFRSDDFESHFEGMIREIEGNKIFTWLYGTSYRWVSDNVVVYISYSDPQLSKPEPLEIVRAYLQKFPSTITMTDAEVKSREHNEKWIKDEMERRLWLCDKWFYQLQLKKVDLRKTLREVVDHLNVFLDYRERYYGVKATDEKNLLWEYLQANDGTSIKRKLKEYKDWWSNNKEKAIGL